MQRHILRNKNSITLISGILIAIGFLSKWTMNNMTVFTWSLIAASVLGVTPIIIQAYQALMVRVVSIDVLVTIAVLGAFFIRNFEESAIVTFLFLFGAYLEQRTLNKTRSAIKELTEMAPESALKQMEDGEFTEVEVDEVDVGDILLVKTGAKVPVDGKVISGEGSINEASITGESIPVVKEEGSNVYAGTILDNGTIQIVADRVGEDTTFGKIIELVEEAQDSKSEAERFIDRFSKYYTPAVLVLAFIVWLFSRNVELAITILVLGCPGALVIGVPVSNVAGIGNGARNGVLLKGSEVIRDFSRLDTMVFDKTGTLTVGNPSVSESVYYGDNIQEAMGSFFKVNLQYFDSFHEYRASYNNQFFTFRLNGETTLHEIRTYHERPYTLVFGNESSGLGSEFDEVGVGVRIPHSQEIDSLNLAVAVGIALNHFSTFIDTLG